MGSDACSIHLVDIGALIMRIFVSAAVDGSECYWRENGVDVDLIQRCDSFQTAQASTIIALVMSILAVVTSIKTCYLGSNKPLPSRNPWLAFVSIFGLTAGTR